MTIYYQEDEIHRQLILFTNNESLLNDTKVYLETKTDLQLR